MLHVLEHGTNTLTNQVIKSLGVEMGDQSIRAPKNFHPFKGRKLHVIYLYLIAVLFFMNVNQKIIFKFPMETNIWPLVLGISKNVT